MRVLLSHIGIGTTLMAEVDAQMDLLGLKISPVIRWIFILQRRHRIGCHCRTIQMTNCIKCKIQDGMAFECIPCCVRWLKSMTSPEQKQNAPVIQAVMGKEFLNQVREAYRKSEK